MQIFPYYSYISFIIIMAPAHFPWFYSLFTLNRNEVFDYYFSYEIHLQIQFSFLQLFLWNWRKKSFSVTEPFRVYINIFFFLQIITFSVKSLCCMSYVMWSDSSSTTPETTCKTSKYCVYLRKMKKIKTTKSKTSFHE